MSEENLSANELEKLLESASLGDNQVASTQTRQTSAKSISASPSIKSFKFIEDVSIQLTIELGRKVMSIKEILKLTEGSLIELDKKVGENLDLLANGKKVGEIRLITVNECYGFQITKILDPEQLASI